MSHSPKWVWDLTLPEEGNPHAIVKETLKSIAKKWVFQLEQGAQTGYRHYQVRLSLREKARRGALFDLLKQHSLVVALDAITLTSKGGANKVWSYVMKEDTRIDGPWKDTDVILPEYLAVTVDQRRQWQEAVDGFPRDRRSVHFVLDVRGQSGKTTFAIARAARDPDHVLYVKVGTSIEHVEQALFAKAESAEPFTDFDIYINIPRTHQMDKREITRLANLIENIKDGHVQEFRYKPRQAFIGLTKLVIFSNEPISGIVDMLSSDRSNCWSITPHMQLHYFGGAQRDYERAEIE